MVEVNRWARDCDASRPPRARPGAKPAAKLAAKPRAKPRVAKPRVKPEPKPLAASQSSVWVVLPWELIMTIPYTAATTTSQRCQPPGEAAGRRIEGVHLSCLLPADSGISREPDIAMIGNPTLAHSCFRCDQSWCRANGGHHSPFQVGFLHLLAPYADQTVHKFDKLDVDVAGSRFHKE